MRTRDQQISIFGKTLTEDELALIIRHPIYAKTAYECSQTAVSRASKRYVGNHGDGEYGNAFQHAYWVMLMYYNTSPSFSISFATAHENYDGNPELHKTMDMYNNTEAFSYCVRLDSDDAGYSDYEIEELAVNLMKIGALQYIIFDYEYVYYSVYYMATGITKEYTKTADLYAYTNSGVPYNIPEPVYEVIPATPDGPVVRP